MGLEWTVALVGWLGALLAYITLGTILYGIFRGIGRKAGRTSGSSILWLHSPWFFVITTFLFLLISWLGWVRLPVETPLHIRAWLLVTGSLFYFPGMALTLWARLALGRNYYVSTGLGAQVFAGQQLIVHGPYAFVRHPMYSGLILAAFGSLLIYGTWTALFYACFTPFIVLRARQEEAALAAEFGEQLQEYRRRVPAFLPRLKR